jgi:HD-GYP domain-containing protein (c-di-GMP phosphodiesterase class II)
MMFSRGFTLNPFAALARHVRWKIIVPFVGLSLIVSLAGTYLTTRVLSGSLRERFENQLIEASRVTSDAFALRERKHLESLRTVTFTNGVARAAADGDSLALERLLLPIAVNSAIDRVEVVDTTGRLLYGVHRTGETTWAAIPLDSATAYQTWTPLQDVFKGPRDGIDKSSGVVDTPEGEALYNAGPLSFEGRAVGAVLIGSRLDSFLATVKLAALGDVTLYGLDGAPLQSTLNEDALGNIATLQPTAEAQASVAQGRTVRETRTLFGRDFDLLYAPLNLRGQPAAVFSVALPSSFISSAASVTRQQMTVLFSLSSLAVMLIGWGVSRALTRPVIKLAATAQAVSDGDLGARSGVDTSDEIGLLARTFDNMTGRLQRQRTSTIRALASAIDARDPYTLGHSVRVGELAARIGRELNLTSLQLQDLEIGGYLHDVGKIGIRDSVLLKQGTLTKEERAIVEEHPLIGLHIIEPIDLPAHILDFVVLHHERLDGTGYPYKFRGEDVPLFARIGAVADMYDALITQRPYKPALSVSEVMSILGREAEIGRIDAKITKILESIVPEWEDRWRDDPVLRGTYEPTLGLVAVS